MGRGMNANPGTLGIDYFIAHPSFRTYALCAAILGLKMLWSALYTARMRGRHRGYINTEDAAVFGAGASPLAAGRTGRARPAWTHRS